MEILNIAAELSNNSYPGRGIIIGKSADGKSAVTAYFIMGRSVNSRNRIFVAEGEGLRTQAYDPALLSDPSLVIYSPVKVNDNNVIVTNGDQTDTINNFLNEGRTFEEALRTRTFEPDNPNYTPRISSIITFNGGSFEYKMSILKSMNGDKNLPQRFFFEYTPRSGLAHFIHTYAGDGDPRIPSFDGEPEPIEIAGDIDTFTNLLWNNLNEENKVSLFVRYIDLETGKTETKILNKNV